MMRLWSQGATDGDEIRRAEQGLQIDEFHPCLLRLLRRCVGVIRQMTHLEGLGKFEHFAPDIAQPDQSEGSPGDAHPHIVQFFVPTSITGEAVFDQQLLAERQDEGDNGCCHRSAHTVGCDG